ncbi:Maf family nucleotide pyrophosphatase [Hufsiella ginkgonis]|uniref:dTTP/UTP pyrophosphatase n=1 Tax=Hufsiella ginkgonis TaxID=2695274 RepID=A0A7K1XX77_9SPHI|nr:Maf family nucleotide pyrophosphatase [Hufsiella ginkgonis]MXV15590.1 septum formation protein Maf [Hufsiella ginkgonis]
MTVNTFPPIILASKSPRRQELLTLMDITFSVILREVDETYPPGLPVEEVASHIAEKKALAFDHQLNGELVITADTVVVLDDQILGKPAGPEDAMTMLRSLSGRTHRVITGVCLLYQDKLVKFSDVTEVVLRELTGDEIRYYVEKYQPLDKAGSYGIQEWIGLTAIESIRGSYTNVVGLPTEKLYKNLLAVTA